MSKTNIFQGRNGITEVVYEVLGYEKTEDMYGWVTQDIYFQAYFYLCNRFGPPIVVDDYKKIMMWDFEVKQYTIRIELNSNWVTFMVFGKSSKYKTLSKNNFLNYFMRSPYWLRYWREQSRKSRKLLNLYSDKRTKAEEKIISKLWNEFFEANNLGADEWTEERFEKEKKGEWFKYLENYNNQVIDVEAFKHYEFRNYRNSKTKHALKTLRQFLNNMLTPIWIRDVPYNLKGSLSDKDAQNYSRFENNIDVTRK